MDASYGTVLIVAFGIAAACCAVGMTCIGAFLGWLIWSAPFAGAFEGLALSALCIAGVLFWWKLGIGG